MPSAKEDGSHEMEGQLSPHEMVSARSPTGSSSSTIREFPSGFVSPAGSAQGDRVILEGTAQGHWPEEHVEIGGAAKTHCPDMRVG
eukprot:3665858-Heterocapsa_arctica.AAC.1